MADEDQDDQAKDEQEQATDETENDEGDADKSEGISIGTGGGVGGKSSEDFGAGGDEEDAPLSGALPGPVNPPGEKPD